MVEATKSTFHAGFVPADNRIDLANKIARSFKIESDSAPQSSRMELPSKILRLLDQVVDDLALVSSSTRPLSVFQLSNIVKAYWLHHAVIADISGLWKFRKSEGNHI